MFNGATVHGIAGIRGLRHPAEIPLLIAAVVTTALGYIGWFGLVTWLVTVPEPTGLSAEIREQILGGRDYLGGDTGHPPHPPAGMDHPRPHVRPAAG